MQHILSILESGDVDKLKELDEAGIAKLKHTAEFLLENTTSLIPINNLKSLRNKANEKILQERTMNMEPSIKLSLDSDGNILITKHESADFNTIFHNSHLLLREYEKVGNIDGIKYELCKLYMMVSIINEKYVHTTSILVSKYKKQDMTKLKSFIMNTEGRAFEDSELAGH
jgi:hypothetical protein